MNEIPFYAGVDANFWIRIGFSVIAGVIVGLERQLRGKPAGIRTSVLVCLGTAMFVYLGQLHDFTGKDPNRVLGQVVTGIGFLGAGVILTRDGLIQGVTSAAVLWMLAAVGAVIGLGYFSMAVILAAVTVVVLVGVEYFEHVFKALRRGVHAHRRNGD